MNFLVDEEKRRIEEALPIYADALIRSADLRGFFLTVSVEGVDQAKPMQRILDDLCKVELVTIDTHYTHRDSQIVAHATPLGLEIAQLLKEEKIW